MHDRRSARIDLSPLRESRDLRLLFSGGTVSFFGSYLTVVALPYQAYRLTHSSLIVGMLSLADLAAILVTGLIGGALADSVDRRRLVLATEAGMAVFSGVLLANSLVHRPELWVLFASTFAIAALDGLQRPSLDAMVPRLVTPEQLPAASAIMSVRIQFGMIASPAIAGVLLAAGGLPVAYGVDIATFAVSLVTLWMLAATPPPPEGPRPDLRSIAEGIRYAGSRKDLLGSYLVDINAMFFGMPQALMPQLASRMGGASALGLLYAAPGVGSALVTLTSGWTSRVERHGRMIAAGATVWGVGIVVLGFAGSLWLALACLVLAGAGDMVSGLGRSTMWNQSIPDGLRGRLAGVELLSYSSGPTLGNVESGLVESLGGLRTSIVSGGVACIAGTVVIAAALPAFWNYRATKGRRLREAAAQAPAVG